MAAVRELLAEGSFHETAVEQVAERAGVSRATLYQHFRSRLDLIDAICDTFDANPALQRLRQSVELADPDAALEETIALVVRFWQRRTPSSLRCTASKRSTPRRAISSNASAPTAAARSNVSPATSTRANGCAPVSARSAPQTCSWS